MYLESESGRLFMDVLRGLDANDILEDLIIIGGWCLPLYKVYYQNDPAIPLIRTMDINILVPRPLKNHKNVNIDELLKEMKFQLIVDAFDGFAKYVHPDTEIEFLSPELGRGMTRPLDIPGLHIKTQTLRYLHLLQDHIFTMSYQGLTITLPLLPAYTLHKYLLSTFINRNKAKAEKDLRTAVELSDFIFSREEELIKLQEIYLTLPLKWKKRLQFVIQDNHQKLYNFLDAK